MQTKEMLFTQSKEFMSLKDTLKACKYSISIQKLSIDLIHLSDIMGFLLESVKSQASLRTLGITFHLFDFKTDIALNQLNKGLRRFGQLERLSLSGRLDDNGIRSLGNALKRMVLLKDIDFTIYMCSEITDSGFRKFAQGLKECKSLKRLLLCFDCCEKITEDGFNGISEAISKLKALKILEFFFISRYEENTVSIRLKSLGQSLESLVNLTDISLNFTEFQSIKDEDMGYVKEGLKKLGTIQSIRLCFVRCRNITESGLKEMCEGIGEVQSLKTFSLKLMKFENITDQGLKALGQVFLKMSFLENLYLNIMICRNVTQVAVDELKRELEKVTGLKVAILYIQAPRN